MKHIGSPSVELKIVGRSGQISLGKRLAGKTLRLKRRDDGSLLLTPMALVPEKDLWTIRAPHRSRIEEGLEWAAEAVAGETDLLDLAKRARSGARRASAAPSSTRKAPRGRR